MHSCYVGVLYGLLNQRCTRLFFLRTENEEPKTKSTALMP